MHSGIFFLAVLIIHLTPYPGYDGFYSIKRYFTSHRCRMLRIIASKRPCALRTLLHFHVSYLLGSAEQNLWFKTLLVYSSY